MITSSSGNSGARARTASRTAVSERRRNGTSWQRERIVSGNGPRSSATRTITAYGGGSSRSFNSASAASSFIVSAPNTRYTRRDASNGRMCRSCRSVADVVDADLVAERLEHVQVGMGAPLHPCVVAEQLGGEQDREVALPDAGRAVQEIRVRRPLGERRGEQALRLVLFRYGFEVAHGSPRPARRRVARRRAATMRSGNRSASSRYAASTRALEVGALALEPVRLAPTRDPRLVGSSRRRTVRSGIRPCTTCRFSSSTCSTPMPRAMPW